MKNNAEIKEQNWAIAKYANRQFGWSSINDYRGYVEGLASKLRYHTSWDELMPVYRKIKDELNNMERPSKNHCCKGDMIEVDIHCAVTSVNIIEAHRKIVEYINWKNENKYTNHKNPVS